MRKNYFPLVRRAAAQVVAALLSVAAYAQTSLVDPAFPPVQATSIINGITIAAQINDVVRQADGKYIVGGSFSAINGVPAANIARLEPSGAVDVAFTAVSGTDGVVNSLALLPDGRLLVGGNFTMLAGSARSNVGRLLSSGAIDAAFAPYVPANNTGQGVSKVLVQPDGQVLVCGFFNLRGAGYSNQYIVRLNGTTGQYDPSFNYSLPTPDTLPSIIVLQPDGYVLVGANGPAYRVAFMLMRLRLDGTRDTDFNVLESTFTAELNALVVDAAGRIYAGGMFQNGDGNALLRRYLPDGTIDPTFTYPRTFTSQYMGHIRALAVQPNGRLLAANTTAERLQANGNFDNSFLTGIEGTIRRFLVQPDGAILVAGRAITGAGPATSSALIRLLDSNVLRVERSAAEIHTAVWPIPAYDVLHLSLDAARRPQRVQLLDVLGRPVLTMEQPTATLTLPVAGLAAGVYQIQVEYGEADRVLKRILLR